MSIELALDEAVNNSEWNALTRAQKKCLLTAVAARRDENGLIKPWHVHFKANVATSKALRPYLWFNRDIHAWQVTPEAIALVAYAQSKQAVSDWYYLRRVNPNASSYYDAILQTRDLALATQLRLEGWEMTTLEWFRYASLDLAQSYRTIHG